MKKAVFLDRDGILIEDTGFPGAVGEIRIIRSAIKAVRTLNELNFITIVITNQSAVARGFTDEAGVQRTNHDIAEHFLAEGARIDDFYYCPHLPKGSVKKYAIKCECRKPQPGLIIKAGVDHSIDLSNSFFIGDSERDLQAALKAGVNPLFVNSIHKSGLDVPSFVTMTGAVNYIIDKNESSKNLRDLKKI